MGGPFKYLWATLAFIFCAGVVAHLLESPGGLLTEVAAAWVQAVGSLVAIGVAIALPRLDQQRIRREYGQAAYAAASVAHQQVSAVWLAAGGKVLMGRPDIATPTPKLMMEELERAARECEAFPLDSARSVAAVMHLRALAACCRGASETLREAVGDGAEEHFRRAHGISNFAYHLLFLIARDAGVQGPPPPGPIMRDGVPPHILEEVARAS